MKNIALYTINDELQIEERGVITREQAIETLNKYSSIQHEASGCAEHVISQSTFGLSVDKKTFIEISPEKEDYFIVRFETPEQRKLLFLTLPGLYQKEIDVIGIESMRQLIDKFYEQTAEEYKVHFKTK